MSDGTAACSDFQYFLERFESRRSASAKRFVKLFDEGISKLKSVIELRAEVETLVKGAESILRRDELEKVATFPPKVDARLELKLYTKNLELYETSFIAAQRDCTPVLQQLDDSLKSSDLLLKEIDNWLAGKPRTVRRNLSRVREAFVTEYQLLVRATEQFREKCRQRTCRYRRQTCHGAREDISRATKVYSDAEYVSVWRRKKLRIDPCRTVSLSKLEEQVAV